MTGFVKKIIPKSIRNLLHWWYAYRGARKYDHPSDKMYVIGVTGTSGKSSTINFLRQILESAGYTVGSLSTIDFYIAGKDKLNDKKMTMLGRSQIQRYLREMVDAGCDIAIVEVTSEGFVQHRHKYINFDSIILTNLYPEHIDSHGSFDKYKAAKLGIFEYVSSGEPKYRLGKYKKIAICDRVDNPEELCTKIPKVCVVNANNTYAREFYELRFDEKYLFGRADQEVFIKSNKAETSKNAVWARDAKVSADGLFFTVDKHKYYARLYGEHNIMNMLAVVALARSIGIEENALLNSVAGLAQPPGRIEFIKEAEEKGFQVIVDYAFEPEAMRRLYDVVDLLKPQRVIHVCGSTGGGRDKARRFSVGKMVAEKSSIFLVTDEDPYDDDRMSIIKDVSKAAQEAGKKLEENLFEILDRGEAIMRAISLARPGDLVLITGKGSEQKICMAGGKMIDWDDREVVRSALSRLT